MLTLESLAGGTGCHHYGTTHRLHNNSTSSPSSSSSPTTRPPHTAVFSAPRRAYLRVLALISMGARGSRPYSSAPKSGSGGSTPQRAASVRNQLTPGRAAVRGGAMPAPQGGWRGGSKTLAKRIMDDHSLFRLVALIFMLAWILVMLAFLYMAPVVSILNLMVLLVIYLFLQSEHLPWHHAQEFENRFWTVMSFFWSLAVFFSRDSPLCIGVWCPSLGFFLAFVIGIAVHWYDRHLHRLHISRVPMFTQRARQALTHSSRHLRSASMNNMPSPHRGGPHTPPQPPSPSLTHTQSERPPSTHTQHQRHHIHRDAYTPPLPSPSSSSSSSPQPLTHAHTYPRAQSRDGRGLSGEVGGAGGLGEGGQHFDPARDRAGSAQSGSSRGGQRCQLHAHQQQQEMYQQYKPGQAVRVQRPPPPQQQQQQQQTGGAMQEGDHVSGDGFTERARGRSQGPPPQPRSTFLPPPSLAHCYSASTCSSCSSLADTASTNNNNNKTTATTTHTDPPAREKQSSPPHGATPTATANSSSSSTSLSSITSNTHTATGGMGDGLPSAAAAGGGGDSGAAVLGASTHYTTRTHTAPGGVAVRPLQQAGTGGGEGGNEGVDASQITAADGVMVVAGSRQMVPATPRTVSPAAPRLLSILLESASSEGGGGLGAATDAVSKSDVHEKLAVVEYAGRAIDQYFVSSTVANLFLTQRILTLEKIIINIFNVARTDELNFLVSHVTLGLLFYKVKDHYFSASRQALHRTELIEVLATNRISELCVPARAMVLDALQQMKLTAHRSSEKWVRNIVLSTLGDQLSELKSLMDAKGDFQSLHKLIFHDIRSEKIRQEILTHIKKQAYIQAAHMKLGTRLARQRRERQPWRKILSDVDDTLECSGGRFPAGIDRRLPRHAVYPGVLAFYRELDLGVAGTEDSWSHDRDHGNLVFLSARPHVYKDVSEKHSYAKFKLLQDRRGMHTTPTLLPGSLDSGYNYVMDRNTEGLAQKKFENFDQFARLYPEYSFVFIGDNGQGDLRAAELMMQKAAQRGDEQVAVDGIFIHRVQPLNESYGYDAGAYERWRTMGLVFFDNYIEAALTAATKQPKPLIRMTGLRRVMEAAVADFLMIDGWSTMRQREARRSELNRSIAKANDVLRKHGVEAVPCISAGHVPRFEAGQRVMTLYGGGIIYTFRPHDAVYEVLLDWAPAKPKPPSNSTTTHATAAPPPQAPTPSLPSSAASSPSRPVKSPRGGGPLPASTSTATPATHATHTPPSPTHTTTSSHNNSHSTPHPFGHHHNGTAAVAASSATCDLPPLSPSHTHMRPRINSDALVVPHTSLSAAPLAAGTGGGGGDDVGGDGVGVGGDNVSGHAGDEGDRGARYSATPAVGSTITPPSPTRAAHTPPSTHKPTPIPSALLPHPSAIAYLQEWAILTVVKDTAVTTKAAAPMSSATSALSSYISFFSGASYLTRSGRQAASAVPTAASDTSASSSSGAKMLVPYAAGTRVQTPYGPAVVLQYRPAATASTALVAVAPPSSPTSSSTPHAQPFPPITRPPPPPPSSSSSSSAAAAPLSSTPLPPLPPSAPLPALPPSTTPTQPPPVTPLLALPPPQPDAPTFHLVDADVMRGVGGGDIVERAVDGVVAVGRQKGEGGATVDGGVNAGSSVAGDGGVEGVRSVHDEGDVGGILDTCGGFTLDGEVDDLRQKPGERGASLLPQPTSLPPPPPTPLTVATATPVSPVRPSAAHGGALPPPLTTIPPPPHPTSSTSSTPPPPPHTATTATGIRSRSGSLTTDPRPTPSTKPPLPPTTPTPTPRDSYVVQYAWGRAYLNASCVTPITSSSTTTSNTPSHSLSSAIARLSPSLDPTRSPYLITGAVMRLLSLGGRHTSSTSATPSATSAAAASHAQQPGVTVPKTVPKEGDGEEGAEGEGESGAGVNVQQDLRVYLERALATGEKVRTRLGDAVVVRRRDGGDGGVWELSMSGGWSGTAYVPSVSAAAFVVTPPSSSLPSSTNAPPSSASSSTTTRSRTLGLRRKDTPTQPSAQAVPSQGILGLFKLGGSSSRVVQAPAAGSGATVAGDSGDSSGSGAPASTSPRSSSAAAAAASAARGGGSDGEGAADGKGTAGCGSIGTGGPTPSSSSATPPTPVSPRASSIDTIITTTTTADPNLPPTSPGRPISSPTAAPTPSLGSGLLRNWWARTVSHRAKKLGVGDRVVVTGFGDAVVLRVRGQEGDAASQVVEVAFTLWRAKGYFRRDMVKLA